MPGGSHQQACKCISRQSWTQTATLSAITVAQTWLEPAPPQWRSNQVALNGPPCHGLQASALLSQTPEPATQELTAALQLVRSSSLNCYLFEALPDDTFETRASLLTQKYELSVSSSRSPGGTWLPTTQCSGCDSISALSGAGSA
jgi:hypothetical protein